MIGSKMLRGVFSRHLLVCYLCMCWLYMMFVHDTSFTSARLPVDTARPVKAGAAIYVIMNYRPVNVGIMHNGTVYIKYRGIITEMAACPYTASKTYT